MDLNSFRMWTNCSLWLCKRFENWLPKIFLFTKVFTQNHVRVFAIAKSHAFNKPHNILEVNCFDDGGRSGSCSTFSSSFIHPELLLVSMNGIFPLYSLRAIKMVIPVVFFSCYKIESWVAILPMKMRSLRTRFFFLSPLGHWNIVLNTFWDCWQ